jgi:acetylglutamate kinase
VISPVGGDSIGNTYNINADYAAAFISGALKAEKLIIMTDIEGVYTDINNPDTLLSSITVEEIKGYTESKVINGGMIPKMECCIDAIERGTENVHLADGRKKHGLLSSIFNESGTKIITGRGAGKCQEAV